MSHRSEPSPFPLEIFLMPEAPTYYCIAVTAQGKLEGPSRYWMSMHRSREIKNSGCVSASARLNSAWSVEVAIPFSVFGRLPEPSEVWRGNICRVARIAKGTGEMFTTWAYLPRLHFHEYAQYNPIRFFEKTLTPEEADRASRRLNSEFSQWYTSALSTKKRQDELLKKLSAFENLSTRPGTSVYPNHYGAGYLLRRKSPPNDRNVWRAPGATKPLAVTIVWRQPIACNAVVIDWYDRKSSPEWYGVEYWDGTRYRLLLENRNNSDSTSVHLFKAVKTTRLRLTIFRAYPRYYSPVARLFRVYYITQERK